MLVPLPIDPLLPDVVRSLAEQPSLVLEAPPGAGKTTRVPRALLEARSGRRRDRRPRAAPPRGPPGRAARRRGAGRGGRRADRLPGPLRGRLERADARSLRHRGGPHAPPPRPIPSSAGSERSSSTSSTSGTSTPTWRSRCSAASSADARPDLRVVVMSATLDAGPIAALPRARRRYAPRGGGSRSRIEHLARADDRPLALAGRVGRAARSCSDGLGRRRPRLPPGRRGDPAGARGVRSDRARGGLAPCSAARRSPAARAGPRDSPRVSAQGDPLDERRRVVGDDRRGRRRSSTAASRASLRTRPGRGLPTLRVEKISRASAAQRAGRAGRRGRDAASASTRRPTTTLDRSMTSPRSRRLDLAQTRLELAAQFGAAARSLEWFEPPPDAAIRAADELLARLGAIDAGGSRPRLGKRMLAFPLHPRLARVLVEAESAGRGRGRCPYRGPRG